jgi:hypothetical protein
MQINKDLSTMIIINHSPHIARITNKGWRTGHEYTDMEFSWENGKKNFRWKNDIKIVVL